ncbi:MAG: helix-turn-helix domain-containing protein [Eubacteriales bacterium]|nr:helix-turn-helix domain-containing protein [Eubacteriales bacterium]
MQLPQKESLFEMMCETFPDAEVFELDGERKLIREHKHELEYSRLFPGLPRYGRTVINDNGKRYSVQVFPTHPGWVCIAGILEPGSGFDGEAAAAAIAEMYFSIDDSQIDEHSRNDNSFLAQLFHIGMTAPTAITIMAAEMDIDPSLKRLITVFRVSAPEMLDKVEEQLRRLLSPVHNDIFGAISDDSIVYCKSIDTDGPLKLTELREFFENVINGLELRDGVTVSCSTGVVVSDFKEYPEALNTVLRTLSPKEKISWAYEHVLDMIMDNAGSEMIYHFFSKYFAYLDTNPAIKDTVEALVEEDMDLIGAAAHCGVHRNTLVFRLNQLRAAWDINPIQNDNDRFFLILLHRLYKEVASGRLEGSDRDNRPQHADSGSSD